MDYKKKLIEVALPLEEINVASAREKSIRHGHPSTLHLWWARRPQAAARAVIWSSLVDDPSAHPEEFPTEEAQNNERERLFDILRDLVIWENSNNPKVLNAAKAEILKSTDGNPPALLDPFAGGGTIPLEAQRLGLKAYASDLNPVAVMINKAMIEIPPKFAGQPPVNPESKKLFRIWAGAQGLAEDVRYYGEWMKQKAWERIGHLYPNVRDEKGKEHTVIAWIWTHTVKCPNPACGCEIPLASSFVLSKNKGKEAFVQPIIDGKKIRYEVRYGKNAPKPPKTGRGQFRCISCGQPVLSEYIRGEGKSKQIGTDLMAIVAEGNSGYINISPSIEHIYISKSKEPDWKPDAKMNQDSTDLVSGRGYGYSQWYELFTLRQLVVLSTFTDLVTEARELIKMDGATDEYVNAVSVYLAFIVDRQANYSSAFNTWGGSFVVQTFGRQAIPMVWDFCESNPFSNSSGCFDNSIDWVIKSIQSLPASIKADVKQADAQTDNGLRDIMVSTDPPYYDNISYADLSDFFYIWMRRSLKEVYPNLFRTLLVPKAEELTAMSYRFEGSKENAYSFFENGMLSTFKMINKYVRNDIPTTVYYAYKQTEESEGSTSSTGWETMLSALTQANFSITGTWPIRTERAGGFRNLDANALASSIVLVCRKREEKAPETTRREFINALKRELKPALQKLQQANIAPVDLAQSAIGPGMAVYSRYSKVLEADGSPMSVRSALQIINQELDLFFTEQDGELDSESRFCIDLYTQYAFNDIKFGEADVLARAKNTSVEKLVGRGVLYAERGVVRLLTREEIPMKPDKDILWLFTQQLTHAMETEGVSGVAKIVANIPGSEPERAKALAYRLFTIAERKGWASEALAYNSLVIASPEVQYTAAQLRDKLGTGKQESLFA